METNANEPLLKCRKRRDESQNQGLVVTLGLVWRIPAYWPDDLRHEDGVNLIQAFMWNVGTCRSDAKGETQVEAPQV